MRLSQRKEVSQACPDSKKHSYSTQTVQGKLWWMIPAMGFIALVWFLVRVIPKPSRAAYPCQRTALPLAGGFVLWLIGGIGSIVSWRYARAFWRLRWHMALACAGISIALGLLTIWYMPEEVLMASSTIANMPIDTLPATSPNAPIGTPRGIHSGRVVWVRDPDATDWMGTNDAGEDIGDGYWWQSNHTNQEVVDKMMSAAIRNLAGEATDGNAWNAFFHYFNQNQGKGDVPYQAGEKIAIKINMVTACRTFTGIVDANGNQTSRLGWINTSPQMILALLRQLVNVVGVAQDDVTVSDTTCYFPNHYWDYIHDEFPDVRYQACNSQWGRTAPTSSQGQSCETRIYWSTDAADGTTPDYLPVSYAEADYLINFACLKGHSAGITLCGKNHYGSLIRTPSEKGFYNLHYSLPNAGFGSPGLGHYRAIVDIIGHSKIGGNTLLYLVDGLYAGYYWEGRPYLWQMEPFNGDWPSSLFVSQDPVAIDSVGYDFLLTEWPFVVAESGLEGGAEDYLHEAALANQPPSQTQYQPDGETYPLTSSLGVHEHWNNSQDKQYSVNLGLGPGIELIQVESSSRHPADFDTDGDVDMSDFGQLQSCMALAGAIPTGCEESDLNMDTAVDALDLSIFLQCLSGADIPADPI